MKATGGTIQKNSDSSFKGSFNSDSNVSSLASSTRVRLFFLLLFYRYYY